MPVSRSPGRDHAPMQVSIEFADNRPVAYIDMDVVPRVGDEVLWGSPIKGIMNKDQVRSYRVYDLFWGLSEEDEPAVHIKLTPA